jgi:hypothetical protein
MNYNCDLNQPFDDGGGDDINVTWLIMSRDFMRDISGIQPVNGWVQSIEININKSI